MIFCEDFGLELLIYVSSNLENMLDKDITINKRNLIYTQLQMFIGTFLIEHRCKVYTNKQVDKVKDILKNYLIKMVNTVNDEK